MIKKNVIISLADSNYFELLNELVDSIKRFKQSNNIAICILDGGLTEEQKFILVPKVHEIKSSDWDIKISQFKTIGKKRGVKASQYIELKSAKFFASR